MEIHEDMNLIGFDMAIGRQKPENVIHTDAFCPFCHRETLTDIIDAEGEFLFLKNKYNVMQGTDQFVLIESTQHLADIPDYSRAKMRRLLRFGVRHWRALQATGKYEDVVFFKNHGPLSGGTIRHPHMQIVGFPKLNPALTYSAADFQGIPIAKQAGVCLNLSLYPRVGFGEFNIVAQEENLDTIADFIHIAVDFLMRHAGPNFTSYNLFFYQTPAGMRVKVMPRFATSPLYIGYNIRFRPSNLEDVAKRMQALYFAHEV